MDMEIALGIFVVLLGIGALLGLLYLIFKQDTIKIEKPDPK